MKKIYHKYTPSINSESLLTDANGDSSRKSSINDSECCTESTEFFTWNNITVVSNRNSIRKVTVPGIVKKSYFVEGTNKILRNVSGYVAPCTTTVIVGGSGSGKTTLLNTLTGNMPFGLKVSGSIKLKGESLNTKQISAYVYQFDALYSRLSIFEHLLFQAKLRLGSSYKYKEAVEKIDKLLIDFNLINLKHAHIGHHGLKTSGISGGERKRVSIISELLTDPLILFLDEPTTGLDIYNAGIMVEMLKNITANGVTVIYTVHQPSSQMIPYFDYLCVLSMGYQPYYGLMKDAPNFFTSVGYECPQNYNQIDHYLRVVGIDFKNAAKSERLIKELAEENRNQNNFPQTGNDLLKPSFLVMLYSFFFGNINILSNLKKFGVLFERDFKLMYRDYYILLFRILSTSIVGIVFSMLYRHAPLSTSNILQFAIIYFIDVANMSLSLIFAVLYTFPNVLQIYRREHRIGMYNTSTFLLSKFFVEIPQILLVTLVYSIIFNFVPLNMYDKVPKAFFLHWAINILVGTISVAVGFLISAVANSILTAIVLGGPLVILFLLVGVFAIKNFQVPYYLKWIRLISWSYYTSETLAITSLNGRDFECNTLLCPPNSVYPYKSALNFLGFNPDNLNYNYGVCCGYTIIVLILCYLYLMIRSFIHER